MPPKRNPTKSNTGEPTKVARTTNNNASTTNINESENQNIAVPTENNCNNNNDNIFYVIHAKGENPILCNTIQEKEEFTREYGSIFTKAETFNSKEEAMSSIQKHKQNHNNSYSNTNIATNNSNNAAMIPPSPNDQSKKTAFLRLAGKKIHASHFMIDLFYDSFAKKVVALLVYKNNKGGMYWCHKPWTFSSCIAAYLETCGYEGLVYDSTNEQAIKQALESLHTLPLRDVNKGPNDILCDKGKDGKPIPNKHGILTIFEPLNKQEPTLTNISEQIFSILQQILASDLFKTGYCSNISELLCSKMKGTNSQYWNHFSTANLIVHHRRPIGNFFIEEHHSYIQSLKRDTALIRTDQSTEV